MSLLNYLIIERPFFITSTGVITPDIGYFVYSSVKFQFLPRTFLEGVYSTVEEVKAIFEGKFFLQKSDYMMNEENIEEAYAYILKYKEANPQSSEEKVMIEAYDKFDLSYEEVEVLERRIFKKMNSLTNRNAVKLCIGH